MADTLYASTADNILAGAVITGTATSTSYALATLGDMLPHERVRWGTSSVSVIFTIGSAKRGDVLIIPAHNLDAGSGSPSVLTLTNGAGLSVSIDVPAMPVDRIPATIAVDLTALQPNATTRTSTTWTLTISNSVNVILGGAVAIYTKNILLPDIGWGFSVKEVRGASEVQNEYLTRYRVDYQTKERTVTATTRTDQLAAVRDWYLASQGSVGASLLWPQPDDTFVASASAGVFDGYVGTWQPGFVYVNVPGTDLYDIAITFRELTKGKPV